jgi:hypothetical protein
LRKDNPDNKFLFRWKSRHRRDIQFIDIDLIVVIAHDYLELPEIDIIKTMNKDLQKHTIKKQKPIIIRPLGDGKYSIVMGFKNYLIAKRADFKSIPIIVIDLDRQGLINEARKIRLPKDEDD